MTVDRNIVTCPSCGKRNRVPDVATGSPACAVCKASMPWLVSATADNLDAVLDANMPVVVDLWAPWCGPCRMVAPILEQLAIDRAGQLKVVKVNVDELPDMSAKYGVQGIPTLLLLDHGREIGRQVGAAPAHVLDSWLDSRLAAAGLS
jgi:thioredoxin 2